jgi:hypothetical protein
MGRGRLTRGFKKPKLISMGGKMEPEIVTRFTELARAKGITFISALRREMIRAISQGEIYGVQEARLPDETESYPPLEDNVNDSDISRIEQERDELETLEAAPMAAPLEPHSQAPHGAERLVLKSTSPTNEDPPSKNQTPTDKPRGGRKKLQPSEAH